MENLIKNIEFYTTPDGEVMVKELNKSVRLLVESDRSIIQELFATIRDLYPDAFRVLSDLYSKSDRNRPYFEYRIVHRFIRCNFSEYDQYNFDIDHEGHFRFEEVHCPLRGECKIEGILCKPKQETNLSSREMDILRLIADGKQTDEIAEDLNISPCTVNHHRCNIEAKLHLNSVAKLINFYNKI